MKHKYLFICGLNRSGTTILQKVLSSAPNASGFHNTGVLMDEGQHLQSVYRQAKHYEGAGKYCFHKEANLTENSSLLNQTNNDKLRMEWNLHWDLSKEILIEKSPMNLIMMRYLNEIFEHAYFLVIIRHPVAVSYATQKWSKTSIESLLLHWITGHFIMLRDSQILKNIQIISYESLIIAPNRVLSKIKDFVGVDVDYDQQFINHNQQYFDRWQNIKKYNVIKSMDKYRSIQKLNPLIEQWGYSLKNLECYPSLDFPLIP